MGARAWLGANQTLATSTATKINVDTSVLDTDGLLVLTNRRIVIDRPGLWLVHASVAFFDNVTGRRIV